VILYLVYREYSISHRVAMRQKAYMDKLAGKHIGIGDGLIGILDNAPVVIQQLHKMKLEAQGKGASPEQLKIFTDRIGWIETMQKFEMPLRVAAPVIDRLGDRVIGLLEKLLT